MPTWLPLGKGVYFPTGELAWHDNCVNILYIVQNPVLAAV